MALALGLGLPAALTPVTAALANDRPFQSARTAVAEDDDQSWSLESWLSRSGALRSLSIEPEYTVDPHHTVQMEFSRQLDREGEGSGHEIELEYKYLHNRFDRDGWGLGLSVALRHERVGEAGARRGIGTLTLKAPLSIGLAGGEALVLHLSPGWAKRQDEPATGVAAAALQWNLHRRAFVFVEASAQRGERFAQAGVRWWLRREKLALDAAWTRQRADGQSQNGIILGLGLYDL